MPWLPGSWPKRVALLLLAGFGLIELLVAVFPANIHMALNPAGFPDMSPGFLYARLPFQVVFAAWVWWATKPDLA